MRQFNTPTSPDMPAEQDILSLLIGAIFIKGKYNAER